MTLNIQIILVPQGAEHRAVCAGLRGVHQPPTVLAVPVGTSSLIPHLERLQRDQVLKPGQRVLVMGLCGGLVTDLPVGTAVLYQTCRIVTQPMAPGLAGDRALGTALQQQLNHALRWVTAVTSDRVISRADEKQYLAQQTQAEVVDMEGFAALQILSDMGVAVATLRVVSDDCQHDIPNLDGAIAVDGSLKPVPLATAMLKQPIAALHLIRSSTKSLKILQRITSELFLPDLN